MKKTIVYDYLFNYFGGDSYGGRIVTGATVSVAFYFIDRKGEVIGFEENQEPRFENDYLCNMLNVYYDREQCYKLTTTKALGELINKNTSIKSICLVCSYSLDCDMTNTPKYHELLQDMPSFIKQIPMSEPIPVTKKEFEDFLKSHVDDFDISDNKPAQVPSVGWIDVNLK
ncbi:hypothetical protein [Blautia producta]|uniref:hypothetical protein n=1 Tax=Blautia producta TaxID=33035 RepID=UPI0035695441